MKLGHLALNLVLGLAATLGCAFEDERTRSSFEQLSYRRISSAPGYVSLGPRELILERGLAVRARVSALGDDGKPLPLLSLRSDDPAVFTIERGPRLGEYVFFGPRSGSTDVSVYSDGERVGRVAAQVIDAHGL
jgi:hypothetical protein